LRKWANQILNGSGGELFVAANVNGRKLVIFFGVCFDFSFFNFVLLFFNVFQLTLTPETLKQTVKLRPGQVRKIWAVMETNFDIATN